MAKYPIHHDYRHYNALKSPMSRPMLYAARILMSVLPNGMRTGRSLSIRRLRISMSDGACIPVYVLQPRFDPVKSRQDAAKAIVYCHGGGFVFKASIVHYRLARIYALKTGCTVIFPDYRLAFDNACGVPAQDCYDVYRYIIANGETLGIDTSSIAVAGDSAGGYLATQITVRAHRDGIVEPDYQMLIYPVLDKRMVTNSMRLYTSTPMWDSRRNRRMWQYYGGGREFESTAEIEDLSYMPTTFVQTAQFDCLHDEGVQFVNRLNRCGVRTYLDATVGTIHGFDVNGGSAITVRALESRISALRRWAANGSKD